MLLTCSNAAYFVRVCGYRLHATQGPSPERPSHTCVPPSTGPCEQMTPSDTICPYTDGHVERIKVQDTKPIAVRRALPGTTAPHTGQDNDDHAPTTYHADKVCPKRDAARTDRSERSGCGQTAAADELHRLECRAFGKPGTANLAMEVLAQARR